MIVANFHINAKILRKNYNVNLPGLNTKNWFEIEEKNHLKNQAWKFTGKIDSKIK